MISKKSVELYFTNNLGWKKLSHLPGDFSVTPSLCGNLLRVFSSNIKNRIDGLSVLGGFGFYSFNENFPFKEYLAINSHISNFHEYFHTPNINSENDLSVFANKISQSLDSLPKTPKDLLVCINNEHIGPYELKKFSDSSPDYDLFVKWLESVV